MLLAEFGFDIPLCARGLVGSECQIHSLARRMIVVDRRSQARPSARRGIGADAETAGGDIVERCGWP